MKYTDQKAIDAMATEFISLRNKAKKNKVIRKKFAEYQNLCMNEFKFLVTGKVNKYRQFPNYQDLEQDGYEALVLALKTYNPSKGSFTWWADKYINTRISRAANAHSTIRFPIKKARELRPFKISTMPIVIDGKPDAIETIETSENSASLLNAIKELPEQHKKLINLIYGFQGLKPHSITNALKALSISRLECLRILEEAKIKLKEKLTVAE